MRKQIVFLVITMLMVKSICVAASEAQAPPGYTSGPYGNHQLVPTAPPELQPVAKFDPTEEVLKRGENRGTVYVVENSSCVCFCPVDVAIIPFLHGITTRLSFGLFGTADSNLETENNHADYVDQGGSYLAIEDDASRSKAVENDDWEKKIA